MFTRFTFLIVFTLTFSHIVVSSSMSVPFQPNWATLSRLSNEAGQLVGDTIDPDEETMMENEGARRILAGRGYISYGAMQKNNVPCNQRGQSYYDCNSRGQANPYSRGCNVITRCGGR
ncbi:rapid alkalinization factor [Tanacetum coccineum]